MARWKARVEFLLSVIEHLFPSLTVEALQGKMCQYSLPSGGVGQIQPRFQRGRGRPLPMIPLERQLIVLHIAADRFYTMKLFSRLLVLCCRNLYERRQI